MSKAPGEIVRSFWKAFEARKLDEVFGELLAPAAPPPHPSDRLAAPAPPAARTTNNV